MNLRNVLRLGSLVPFLLIAGCSESSPPQTSGGSGGASGSAGGTGGGSGGQQGTGGQSGSGGSGSGGQSGSGSGGATGGSAGGTGGSDAGADTSRPETSGGDGAVSGVVVDPTTGNGKFEFSGPQAVPADAVLKPGVTAGTVQTVTVTGRVFPGPRTIHVYKPNGYVANTPVAFMVLFDNDDYIMRFKIPTIIDNYLAEKKLPMIVGIFIAEHLQNRSVEYDSLNDANTRFVVEDIFPEVEKLGIKLSTDPDASCVGGHSSGGIAAFTMGWHRPDRFHRILSNSGSFTNIRGGNAYPMMVRSNPPKPLRVFLTAGTMDNGGWENASEQMHLAFMATGYQYRYIRMIGGTHNQLSPATIMPENLLWLWKGFPLSGATR